MPRTLPAPTLPAPVLLVVDVQGGAFDGERCAPVGAPDKLLRSVCRLVAAAREAGRPVLFVQHADGPEGIFEVGTPQWQLHDCLEPRDDEPVVHKRAADAFEGTDLAGRLERLGARALVLCGLQSEGCVAMTARSALRRGLAVHLAHDGHSTWPADGQEATVLVERVNAELAAEGVQVASADALAAALRAPLTA